MLTGRQFVVANAGQSCTTSPDPGVRPPRLRSRWWWHEEHGLHDRDVLQGDAAADQDGLVAGAPRLGAAARRAIFNGMEVTRGSGCTWMELLRRWAGPDRAARVLSSTCLEEVEQVARQIEVAVAGRRAASGDFGAIRRLMTDQPNRFVFRTSDDRRHRIGTGRQPVGAPVLLQIEVEASDFADSASNKTCHFPTPWWSRNSVGDPTVLTVGPLPHWLHIQRPAEPLC